jgi:cytoskeletal protein CcmA (bactofilin family)
MTTIGPSLIITGELTSQEDVTIHGKVKGQIRMSEGALLVAPKGNIDADIEGTRVTIHGTVAGSVVAADRIELTPTANVTGTLTTRSVVLQDGATFNGIVDMDREAVKSKKQSGPATVIPISKAS